MSSNSQPTPSHGTISEKPRLIPVTASPPNTSQLGNVEKGDRKIERLDSTTWTQVVIMLFIPYTLLVLLLTYLLATYLWGLERPYSFKVISKFEITFTIYSLLVMVGSVVIIGWVMNKGEIPLASRPIQIVIALFGFFGWLTVTIIFTSTAGRSYFYAEVSNLINDNAATEVIMSDATLELCLITILASFIPLVSIWIGWKVKRGTWEEAMPGMKKKEACHGFWKSFEEVGLMLRE